MRRLAIFAFHFAFCILPFAFSIPHLARAIDITWEGELPLGTNFPKNDSFGAKGMGKNAALLSGNDWLSTCGNRGKDEVYVRYAVKVPADGVYHFWARKFWAHGPFRWRFGAGDAGLTAKEWEFCSRDVGLADDVPLKKNVNVNWVNLGDVTLKKGETICDIRLTAKEGEDVTCAFDCFLLTQDLFLPNGKLKPGEKWNRADEGFFPWEPAVDRFTDDALLDLRSMNEATAGMNGFVRKDGEHFALGDGSRVRFFAVNVGPNNLRQSHESVDYLARKLAKLGVNMVRIHAALFDRKNPGAVDPAMVDSEQYFISALKKQGIYTYISFYYPLWISAEPGGGYPEFKGNKNHQPFSLLFFDERTQAIHRKIISQLLTTPNPYAGGTPLAKDPAVAIVELCNEDSLFFWTFTKANIPADDWTELRKQFAAWLTKRYGSLDAAKQRWAGAKVHDDTDDLPGLYEAAELTSGAIGTNDGRIARASDQVRFMTDLQRGFYADAGKYIKTELGFGGLINASNWGTTDAKLYSALERYTYTATDMTDQHAYFGGKTRNDAGFLVRPGDEFTEAAAVLEPGRLPARFGRIEGYPIIVSEIGWMQPGRFRSDATLLQAACSSLQDYDGIFFFAINSNSLVDPAIQKLSLSDPTMAATFPAAALMYRRGDVSTPAASAYEVVSPEDLLSLKAIKTRGNLPPMSDLAYFAGPVVRTFGAGKQKPFHRDTAKEIDKSAKLIRTDNGELNWDYGVGVARVDTPRTQAAAGFLSKVGKIDLGDVSIECGNEFASIVATSLDGQPIGSSKKVLIQAMTEEQPFGWKTTEGNDGWKKIVDLGASPFEVRKVDAKVTFKAGFAKAVALDENGYATAPIDSAGNSIVVPAGNVYVVVTR